MKPQSQSSPNKIVLITLLSILAGVILVPVGLVMLYLSLAHAAPGQDEKADPAFAGSNVTEIDIYAVSMGDYVDKIEGDPPILKLTATSGRPETIKVLDMPHPGITEDSYAVVGEVRVTGMGDAKSYLETWNRFRPAGSQDVQVEAGQDSLESYFTRSLDESGPAQYLRRDQEWRPFMLPFSVSDHSGRTPEEITLNVHFAEGKGTVELRGLALVDGLDAAGQLSGPLTPQEAFAPMRTALVILAVAVVAVVLAVLAGLFLFVWRRKGAKTRAELRRIRAADI